MIFMVNVKLALCMMAVLPFCLFTTYLQSKHVKPRFHECRQSFSSLNAFVQENISGNRVVKAFAKEEYEKEKFEKENDKYREAELGAASIWCRFVPIFELLSNLLMVVLILYGGYQVICGEMTLGNLVTVNGYLWMLSNPLRFAGWWVNDVQRFITSVEKIYDTYSKEPDVKKPKKGIKRKEMQGNIEFRNVSYEVEGEDIIHNISFSVEKGQTVGILGSTGAGKSTIMNLLCRFYDVTEGEVLVDGIDVKIGICMICATISVWRCRMSFCFPIRLREILPTESRTALLKRSKRQRLCRMRICLSRRCRTAIKRLLASAE